MVTGGLAAIIYGEPRLTNTWTSCCVSRPGRPKPWWPPTPRRRTARTPLEVIRAEAARPADGNFKILDVETSLRADVYCLGEDDLLGAWAMKRRREIPVAGTAIPVAPIEYVIVRKLEYYRMAGSDRHLGDVRAIDLAVASGAFIGRAWPPPKVGALCAACARRAGEQRRIAGVAARVTPPRTDRSPATPPRLR
jgi:hypothetical protein